jgi:hypothetical protein
MEFDIELFQNEIVDELTQRYKFLSGDNMLENPDQSLMWTAIWDALQDVNSSPPQTSITFEMLADPAFDPRWKRLVLMGAALQLIQELIVWWTHSGFSATVGDVPVESKLSDFKDTHSLLKTEFDEKLEKLKNASQKFARLVATTPHRTSVLYPTVPGSLLRAAYLRSGRS